MSSSPSKHAIYLGMGSNSYRKANLRFGLDAIREIVSDMEISPVVLSEAVGVQTDMFFNLVVRGFCTIALDELSNRIKQIESMTGRTKSTNRVSLDIDILMYGTSEGIAVGLGLPSPDLLNAPPVLYPLSRCWHPTKYIPWYQIPVKTYGIATHARLHYGPCSSTGMAAS